MSQSRELLFPHQAGRWFGVNLDTADLEPTSAVRMRRGLRID